MPAKEDALGSVNTIKKVSSIFHLKWGSKLRTFKLRNRLVNGLQTTRQPTAQ